MWSFPAFPQLVQGNTFCSKVVSAWTQPSTWLLKHAPWVYVILFLVLIYIACSIVLASGIVPRKLVEVAHIHKHQNPRLFIQNERKNLNFCYISFLQLLYQITTHLVAEQSESKTSSLVQNQGIHRTALPLEDLRENSFPGLFQILEPHSLHSLALGPMLNLQNQQCSIIAQCHIFFFLCVQYPFASLL